MSSEVYSYLYDKVLNEGALDIYCESIQMKKNRPAYKVSILCNKIDLDKFSKILLLETSSFGVRYHKYNRIILERKIVKMDTEYGTINVKLGYYEGRIIKATPEYEDIKIICKDNMISFSNVLNKINCNINKKFDINLLT